ncbi:putative nitrate reductase molybdenum cofactor assembly chaperone NarW [Paraburkholderia domus]|jgi:nitrate reductase molybdenum cofactor assembly chaperone|uniref:Nitrate reductase molybdenum cofactor assembly chaperone NarW n=1 Tax=Paraburkholderia domus TaxID=2793075 RepID=A0A9N8MPR9_9BURK|nr:nitrate reductase molybdenum cofactor assembly chaperone [Paraburkholderia domus]MBK5051288.1 nitrate reductase molybdenum cofactor assembly chaperone [Burkholderia sp. R-70006]MBK5061548.1 nitrate reductase molybdenum cofactor assembly chaperone [Burkholderia sp. R-70199]MBK5088377.1 nitrate reductase molybdenum cofactor assembly chaperone [Burkholderia sp. R-69927]MBK5122774.1 nitrate reductase molybdenum cofactor assembly chaperone [Burkholderia sp. R-69980]MBK5165358.1 nitrate reductase
MEDNRLIFSMLGALLDYPDQTLIVALDEIRTALAGHPGLPSDTRVALIELVDRLSARPLLDLQEDYVEIFDRGRATSLYLFEHVHGESRERGQAMVDLLAMYEANGLFLGAGELPDYLPVFLEFLSHETPAQAHALLGEIADISRQIATSLAERGTPYFAAVAALLPLAGEAPLANANTTVSDAATTREIDAEALDREWQEEPVSFLGAQAPLSTAPQPIQFYDKRPSR